MTLFDDNSSVPTDGGAIPPSPQEPAAAEQTGTSIAGDPITYAGNASVVAPPRPVLPEDLRISWSWPHFLLFLFFVVVALVAVNIIVVGYLAGQHVTPKEMQRIAESDPVIAIGSSVLVFALIMLFLYVTLSVLRETSFWRSLGWRELNSPPGGKGRPWMYLLAGGGLSIFVAAAGSRVKMVDHAPIQDLLTNRTGALLVMGMAVLVAPLVEETVFRGYLYPTLARMVSSMTEFFGLECSLAQRTGVASSILLTGILFGLLHGAQLGWTFGFVSLLVLVGVVFTFARAWSGTVLASFLLHLGYNSTIAITTIIATHGFTQIPTR